MKIALIGATGYVGTHLLEEALRRGHAVTAIVRNPERLPAHPQLTGLALDISNAEALRAAIEGHALLISAFNPLHDADGQTTRAIISAAKRARIPRLLAVGGAGSLQLPGGQRLVDQPDFPAEWKQGALRTAAFLEQLQQERELDWVFLSPAAELLPGRRSGQYRLGEDALLTDAQGKSQISLQDYAVAMLDEAEQPRHHRKRFSVAALAV